MNRILLVEDDESNRVTLAGLLDEEGFQVDAAESFVAATRLLEARGPSYDAIVLDQTLQDGWGAELIPLVRATHSNAKVLVLSGVVVSPQTHDEADAVLPKGIYFPDLVARLRALVADRK